MKMVINLLSSMFLVLIVTVVTGVYSKETDTPCIFDNNIAACVARNLFDEDLQTVTTFLKNHAGNSTDSLVLSENNIMYIDPSIYSVRRNISRLILNKNKLYAIPKGVSQIQYLDLECKQLKVLSNFDGYTNLKELRLSYNKIQEIRTNVFQDASKLEILSLAANVITLVKPGAFKGLVNLQELDLSYNELDNIDKGLFEDLKSIKSISLIKNKLSIIKKGILWNLTKLQEFNARYNNITNIEHGAFENVATSIKSIDLRNNKLNKVDQGVFRRLGQLKVLGLARNEISKVATLAFDKLKLNLLDLSKNKITELHPQMFEGLKILQKLDLSNNPIKCDCEMHFKMNHYIESSKIDGYCTGYQSHLLIRDVIVKNALKCHPCLRNPCKNDGTCNPVKDDYFCRCTKYFKGNHCEIKKQECEFVQCLNGGICNNNSVNEYVCSCKEGFKDIYWYQSIGIIEPMLLSFEQELGVSTDVRISFDQELGLSTGVMTSRRQHFIDITLKEFLKPHGGRPEINIGV